MLAITEEKTPDVLLCDENELAGRLSDAAPGEWVPYFRGNLVFVCKDGSEPHELDEFARSVRFVRDWIAAHIQRASDKKPAIAPFLTTAQRRLSSQKDDIEYLVAKV